MTNRPRGTNPARARSLVVLLTLALLTAAAYRSLGDSGFVGFDVEDYVTANPDVQAGITRQSVAWAFTRSHAANWHPLTWLSHMLDVRLFGLDARGHHLVSLLLHVASTLLLYLVLHGFTGARGRSAFVAALFAVHPLHVESVAWVAQRKDTLSTFFWVATMGAYLSYARRPAIGRYLPIAATFTLGLLAKPMLVTLPFVMLLLDFWPLGRLRRTGAHVLGRATGSPPGSRGTSTGRLVAEKAPLLLLSLVSSVITYRVQDHWGAVRGLDQHAFASRLANALVAAAEYPRKAFLPFDLAVFYPFAERLPAWRPLIAGLGLALATAVVVAWRRRHPYLTLGWFWYAGTLVPVIGIVQVGSQAMADRYTYVPLTGILIMLAWGVPALAARRGWARVVPPVLAAASIAGCLVLTTRQVGYWRDDVALFEHALRVTGDNWKARLNLGHALQRLGRFSEAQAHYAVARSLKPDYAEAHARLGLQPRGAQEAYDLGASLARQGRSADAAAAFRASLQLAPDNGRTHNDLGAELLKLGRAQEAVAHFDDAVRLNPLDLPPLFNQAIALQQLGRDAEAVEALARAVRIAPESAEARLRLARAQAGR